MAKATHTPMWRQLKFNPRNRAHDLMNARTFHNIREHMKTTLRVVGFVDTMILIEHGMGNNGFTNLRF